MRAPSIVTVTLPEWSKCNPGERSALAGLVLDERSRELAAELHRRRIVTVRERYDGLEVQTYAFVGRLRVGPLQVTMHPKLGGRPLRQLFRYAYGLEDVKRFEVTEFSEGGELFPDLLAEQLLGEVEQLLRHVLRRAYERREGWLPTVRGRVDVGRRAERFGRRCRARITSGWRTRCSTGYYWRGCGWRRGRVRAERWRRSFVGWRGGCRLGSGSYGCRRRCWWRRSEG